MNIRPGVSDAFLAASGVEEISGEESSSKIGIESLGPGLLIPYYDITQTYIGFDRFRLHTPRGQMKYTQPPASAVHVYIPPHPFDLGLGDLYIVEGEFKALALREEGYNAVAIAGFFGGLVDKTDLHPELRGILDYLQPKNVYWCGDSDTALNPDFYLATERYAKLLPELKLVRIPFDCLDKAADDMRNSNPSGFRALWDSLPRVPADADAVTLIEVLLSLHKDEIDTSVNKILRKLSKLMSAFQNREGFSIVLDDVIATFKLKAGTFRKALKESRKAKGGNSPGSLPSEAALLVSRTYCVNGGEWCVDLGNRGKFTFLKGELWKNELAVCGCDPDQMNAAMSEVIRNRLVDWAGGLAGKYRGMHNDGTDRILVTDSPTVIEGVPTDKDIYETKAGAFVKTLLGDTQVEYFLSWLHVARRFLTSAVDYQVGQAVVFAGDTGVGKTLLQALITKALGGRQANPTEWILSKTRFNDDLAAAEHLLMSDDGIEKSNKARDIMSSTIKKIVANDGIRVERKFGSANVMKLCWRLTISCNLSPNSLRAVPEIDEDNQDKIILFKCFRGWDFSDGTNAKDAILEDFEEFLYLIDNYEIPEDITDARYGVTAFQHPDIMELTYHDSAHSSIDEVIHAYLDANDVKEMRGSAAELFSILTGFDTAGWMGGPGVLGKRLRILTSTPNSPLKVTHGMERGNLKRWTISRR